VVYGRWDSNDENVYKAYDSKRMEWARGNLPGDSAAYNDGNEYDKFRSTGEMGEGKLSVIEFAQAIERICKGYTAAGY
jgi:hypothetical protein